MLCGCFLPDSLFEILLSAGIYGSAYDVSYRQLSKGNGIYHELQKHGDRNTATGCELQSGRLLCAGRQDSFFLTALKSVGRPVIEGIVAERAANGNYKTLEDFITRTSELDINKRVIENLIKAGAFDSLPGTRKQKMFVYAGLVDRLVKDKKNNLVGQMSLFDLVGEEEKSDFHTPLPDVGEFDRQ